MPVGVTVPSAAALTPAAALATPTAPAMAVPASGGENAAECAAMLARAVAA